MVKPPDRVPLDALVDLACRDGVDVRPTLLRVLTDLYVQKPIHDADEESQYVALVLGLIDSVDPATRSAVAAILSAYPGAPSAVLLRLAGVRRQGFNAAPRKGADVPAPRRAEPVRRESIRSDLVDIFFSAGTEERRLILRNLDIDPEGAKRPPLFVAGELLRRLERAALSRNVGEFGRVLERALGISAELAARIARDDSGEPVVVAAKALGMSSEVLSRILLFLNPVIGQSAARIYELTRLFEDITAGAAIRMVAIWKSGAPADAVTEQPLAARTPAHPSAHAAGQAHASAHKRPVHAPYYWNDERPAARGPSTPVQPGPQERPTERPLPAQRNLKAK